MRYILTEQVDIRRQSFMENNDRGAFTKNFAFCGANLNDDLMMNNLNDDFKLI